MICDVEGSIKGRTCMNYLFHREISAFFISNKIKGKLNYPHSKIYRKSFKSKKRSQVRYHSSMEYRVAEGDRQMENISRHKINEATHFISMMEETLGDDEIFSYNLSAYFSAARSITYYMQKQYKRIEGFPEWYCCKQLKMSADPDLKYLIKARDQTIHEQPVDTLPYIESRETFYIPMNPIDKEGNKSKEAVYGYDIPVHYEKLKNRLLSEYENKDAIIFFEKQLNKLTKIVEECEQKFG